MDLTDWEQLRLTGMAGYEAALRRHEAALLELETGLLELRAGLPTGARMETVWFRRYTQLMLALWQAGLPHEVEPERVGEWLASRIGGDGRSASGDGAGIGSGTVSCRREVIADLGGGWKLEAIEVPEGPDASVIYFREISDAGESLRRADI